MATLQTGALNTGEYERQIIEGGTPLPPGVYTGIVVKAAQKGVKNNGVMLEVEIDITKPVEFANRKFWDRFNLVNANLDTVRIAKEGLADLAKAAGIAMLSDDQDLIGREVIMELYVEKGKAYQDKHTGAMKEGKDQNRCKKYWPVGTNVDEARKAYKANQKANPAPMAKAGWGNPAPAQATPAPAAPQTDVAPWKRNKA